MLLVAGLAVKSLRRRVITGATGLVGQRGTALENFTTEGRVFVNGEIWRAAVAEGLVEKDAPIEIVRVVDHLTVEVKKV
jgi:membrane protein implicated in regulation of membrane protease activity